MKGFELVKREDHWDLYNEDGHKIASTLDGCNSKLSIKNCEEIFNGYDLDKLAENTYREYPTDLKESEYHYNRDYQVHKKRKAFIKGFNAAVEILGDKKFSEDDMVEFAMSMISQYQFGNTNIHNRELLKESLPQQTEFDVELVMECCGNYSAPCKYNCEYGQKPKLDAEGNLILKRIEK